MQQIQIVNRYTNGNEEIKNLSFDNYKDVSNLSNGHNESSISFDEGMKLEFQYGKKQDKEENNEKEEERIVSKEKNSINNQVLEIPKVEEESKLPSKDNTMSLQEKIINNIPHHSFERDINEKETKNILSAPMAPMKKCSSVDILPQFNFEAKENINTQTKPKPTKWQSGHLRSGNEKYLKENTFNNLNSPQASPEKNYNNVNTDENLKEKGRELYNIDINRGEFGERFNKD